MHRWRAIGVLQGKMGPCQPERGEPLVWPWPPICCPCLVGWSGAGRGPVRRDTGQEGDPLFLPTVDGAWPADVPDGARQVEDHRQGCATTACASSSWGAQGSLGGGSVRRRLTQSGVAPWLRINYVPTPPRLGRQAPILLSFAVSKKFRWLALIDKQEASISARILASHPARPLPGAARVSWPADDNEDRLQGTA